MLPQKHKVKEIKIIAGPNGSGKSTFCNMAEIVETHNYINADHIEREFFLHLPREDREKAASILAARAVSDCLKQGKSFVLETVFAVRTMPTFIQRAKTDGYHITTIFSRH
jgi:predicted ABC-type ATPase